ncbi:MAG: heme-copper oxidase subunit III [Acidimicrobiia bacterium]
MAETMTAPAGTGHHAEHDDHAHVTNTGISNEKLGMWLFLGSECLLFGGLISTFLLYKKKLNTFPGFENTTVNKLGANLFDIPFTSVSSFVLLMSSLTMVLAVSALQRDDLRRTRAWLLATALLGSTFLAGQVYEFTAFVNEGLGFTTNIFSSAFFTLTGFHGAHVLIGIIILMTMYALSMRGRLSSRNAEALEIAGLYWHFVDVVWVVIFVVVYLIK